MELETTIGHGDAEVTVEFDMVADAVLCYDSATGRDYEEKIYECEISAVMFQGVNIMDCLDADCIVSLGMECQEHAAEQAEIEKECDV